MKALRPLLVLLGIVLLMACGGDTPTGPDSTEKVRPEWAPDPKRLTVRLDSTGQVITSSATTRDTVLYTGALLTNGGFDSARVKLFLNGVQAHSNKTRSKSISYRKVSPLANDSVKVKQTWEVWRGPGKRTAGDSIWVYGPKTSTPPPPPPDTTTPPPPPPPDTTTPPPPPPPTGGIAVSPGQSIQSAVNGAPEGATFILKAGTHRRQTILPKHRQTFTCEAGAVLDGEGVTQFAFTRNVGDPDNVTIRGCHITRYAPPIQHGAINGGWYETFPNDRTTGWLLEDVEVSHTASGGGIALGHKMTLRRVNVHHNFQIGVVGMGDSVLVVDSEIAYNNHLKLSDQGFEAGGTKFKKTRWLTVRNTWVHHNVGPGLWTDIDNVWTLYELNRVEDNAGAGIAHEISYDAVIRNNQVRRNGFLWGNPPGTGDSWGWGGGIEIASSGNTEVYGNIVEANKGGINLVQQNRGSGNRGAYLVQNVWVHHNTVSLTATNRHHGAVQDVGSNLIFSGRNNRYTDNTYRLTGAQSNPFRWNNGLLTESQWRAAGQDVNGTFTR